MEAHLILVILKKKLNKGGVPLNFYEGGRDLKKLSVGGGGLQKL